MALTFCTHCNNILIQAGRFAYGPCRWAGAGVGARELVVVVEAVVVVVAAAAAVAEVVVVEAVAENAC